MIDLFAALAFATTLALPPNDPKPAPVPSMPAGQWFVGGRVYASDFVHVGARPAILVTNEDRERGIGFTFQVSLSCKKTLCPLL